MLKKIIILTFVTSLACNTAFAGVAKLADFMISGSGIIELLGKYGIKGTDAKQVESYVSSSLMALGSKKVLSLLKNIKSNKNNEYSNYFKKICQIDGYDISIPPDLMLDLENKIITKLKN